MNTLQKVSVLVFLLLAVSISGTAQIETTGTVLGAVVDPAGAAVPNAVVELHDTRTTTVRRTKTNENGRYIFV
jgi:protocatechuate 3,4-dioxygenase beta subunit